MLHSGAYHNRPVVQTWGPKRRFFSPIELELRFLLWLLSQQDKKAEIHLTGMGGLNVNDNK